MIKRYDIDGNLIETIMTEDVIIKSIYTRTEFFSKIDNSKIREIETIKETNDIINNWIFNLQYIDKIDLNNLEEWFIDGMNELVTEGILTEVEKNELLEI